MTSSFDIRQALWDLRTQTYERGNIDWDFLGDVTVGVEQDGAAPALGELLRVAWEQQDVVLASNALYPKADDVLLPSYKLDDKLRWAVEDRRGYSVEHRESFDEVWFAYRYRGDTFSGYGFDDPLPRPMFYSLRADFAGFGEWHKAPKDIREHEYHIHAEWPWMWGSDNTLPPLYRNLIALSEGTPLYRQVKDFRTPLPVRPAHGQLNVTSGGGSNARRVYTLTMGFDYYAMWVAFDDHPKLLRAFADMARRTGFDGDGF